MNLGPNTVSSTYQFVLNQSGNNPITLGSGQAVNWDAAGVVTINGNQNISGAKYFFGDVQFLGSNNVFGTNNNNNVFGDFASYNTFGNYSDYCQFGMDAQYNYFGTKDLGPGCINIFGENAIDNQFGNYSASNAFGYGGYINNFGTDGNINYFGSQAESTVQNYFGQYASYNSFGNNASTNTFGNACPANEFACYISSSSIENYFAIQNGLEEGISSIKNEFGGILLGQQNTNSIQILNHFGNESNENYFGYKANSNYFGYNASTLTDGTFNYFGGNSQKNYFGDLGINGNYFGRSATNYFGNTQSTNYFGGSGSTNYFYGGQFLNEARLLLPQFAGARSQAGQLGELRISGSGLYVCTGATGGWGRTFLLSNF